MSQRKCKLVLKTLKDETPVGGPVVNTFEIVKTTNTMDHGIPSDVLTKDEVKLLLKINDIKIRQNALTVEFIK